MKIILSSYKIINLLRYSHQDEIDFKSRSSSKGEHSQWSFGHSCGISRINLNQLSARLEKWCFLSWIVRRRSLTSAIKLRALLIDERFANFLSTGYPIHQSRVTAQRTMRENRSISDDRNNLFTYLFIDMSISTNLDFYLIKIKIITKT